MFSVRDALGSIMETVHVCCVGKDLRLNTQLSFENIDVIQHMVADACECGNEPSGSVKCREFLD